MAKYVDYKKMQEQLLKRTDGYAANVRIIYQRAFEEIIDLVKGTELEDGKPFSFSDYGYGEEVGKILRSMYSQIYQVIRGGVQKEWLTSNENNDGLVKSVFGEQSLDDVRFSKLFQRNKEAMDAFFARKSADGGLNLSQRVWKYTGMFRHELENTLDLAIGEGTPANRIAAKIKQYLDEPDKWYRRFRVKIGEDEDGNPVYGRKWKRRIWDNESDSYKWIDDNPKDYHPGKGVYRSSARNAQRLARTETNMAYRMADYERWQQLDFVIGIEIKRSNHYYPCTVCESLKGIYPKTFKWKGWHPNCRCFQVPVLAKGDEIEEMLEKILDGESTATVPCDGKLTKLPKHFTDWMDENESRINGARERGTLPYFIRDNERLINPPTAKEIAKQRHDARTPEQIESIKKAWWERKATYHYGTNVINIMDGISDVDTSALKEALKHPDLSAIMQEAKKLKSIGKEIYSLDKLDNPMQVAKDFSLADARIVNKAVSDKLAHIAHGDLNGQLNSLEFEIQWVTDHKKYATWEVAAKAYGKAKKEVEEKIQVETQRNRLNSLSDFLKKHPKNKKVKQLFKDAIAELDNGNVKAAETIIDKAYVDVQAFLDKKNKEALKNLGKLPKELEEYIDKHYTTNFTVHSQESYERVMDMFADVTKRPWNNASKDEREAFPSYTNSSATSCRVLTNVGLGRPEPLANKLDAILDKVATKEDLVLRSGQCWDVAEYVFGKDFKDILRKGDLHELNNKYAGTVGLNKAYMSTSFNEKGGFTKDFEVHIYAPKGTHCMNLNEISYFGQNKGAAWDGESYVSLWSQFGETEIFLHRGYKWKFVKAEKGTGKGGTNRIYVQLLDRVP